MSERPPHAAEAPETLCDLFARAVRSCPARPAVITDGEAIDYAELGRRAQAVARLIAGLRARNPRVALLTEGGLAHVVLYWGILLAGRVSLELNPGLGDPELEAQLEDAEPDLLIAERGQAARLPALRRALTRVSAKLAALEETAEPGDDLGARLLAAVEGRGAASPFAPERVPGRGPGWRPGAGDLASIVYTSGTTGRTKGVCLSHGNLAWTARAIAESFALGTGADDERFSGLLPLYYTYGKSVLHLATSLGAPIAFTRRLASPANLIEVLNAERITHLSAVPYLCNVLLTSPGFTAAALPQLRRITIAGGAVSEAAMGELLARFPGMIVPMYGLTEASTRVTCMPPGEAAARPRSCGRPLPGVEVKTLGDEGEGEGEGEGEREGEGEIVVRGPNLMRGYFRDEAATAAVLSGGWLRTGDLGSLDGEGYLTVSGRLKDVIKIMGESVSPFGIESAIAALPGVAEVAVKGVPEPMAGEAIAAFVVLEPGAEVSEAEICGACARALGRARVPRHVRFLPALPKTASGKVRKHLLPFGDGPPD